MTSELGKDGLVPTSSARPRFPLVEWSYVLGVAVLATLGFTTGSTPTILLAAFVALPASVLAVPVFYGAYGLLALVPGANPSSSTGSGSCTPTGDCQSSSTGALATWFALTTDVLGILALAGAALLNVLVLRGLVAGRRARRQEPGGG